MKHRHLLLSIAIVPALAASVNAATILNSTTFDGTEPTSNGNAGSFYNPGSTTYDTVNGWTWGTTASTTAESGVFSNLPGTVGDQGIRTTAGSELTGGQFIFGWGGSGTYLALAQGFSVTVGQTITITYDMSSSLGGMYLYVDNGDGTGYGTGPSARDHLMTNGTGKTYSFDAMGSNIRIAVVGNDGADSNANLQSISVSSVPEPSAALLGGLGLLALLRRRR